MLWEVLKKRFYIAYFKVEYLTIKVKIVQYESQIYSRDIINLGLHQWSERGTDWNYLLFSMLMIYQYRNMNEAVKPVEVYLLYYVS